MASGSTYTWEISKLDVTLNFNGLINFVTGVHWVYAGLDISGNTANIQGYDTFNYDGPNFYIPYSSLTQTIVSSWLNKLNSVAILQNVIDQQIQSNITPV